ncbi:MAG: hypothetical protein JWO31_2784 [Phycisphaerales bacterium]|nr:hypothetical protein [Phycisphaerales bacterium]
MPLPSPAVADRTMRHATRRRSDRSRRSLARVAAAGAAAGAAAWVLVTGWAATPAAAQARPARVAPDPNAAARRERLAQFQAAERAARDLPRLPATRPDDVFRLGVRNRAIVVEVVPGSDGRRPTGDQAPRPHRSGHLSGPRVAVVIEHFR